MITAGNLDLFNSTIDPSKNLLPKDGIVNYYGKIFNNQDAKFYNDTLMNSIAWENDQVKLYGKLIITKRKMAWYGDQTFAYTYSNTTRQALAWTKELLELKSIVEKKTANSFNSCLLNLYHHGEEGMGWHSDAEKELKENAAIASLSFGAERKFSFKHKLTKESLSILLEHGSLLVMKGTIQTHWLHQLPPTKRVDKPRINLTFRSFKH